jgi:hypothetical protein
MPEGSRTMIRRHLANALAWSSLRDGRWVLVLTLLFYFAILAALIGSRHWSSAWRTLGVAGHPIKFYDALFIATTAESHRAGYDAYAENPYDPGGRRMAYPRIWLALASLGLSRDHTAKLAIGMAAAFFGSLLCWAGRVNIARGLTLGGFLCSPHIMWIVERGNVDQVIFVILASALTVVRRYPKARPILYASIVAASILKYYPAAGLTAVARERSWRAPSWGLAILLAFSAYLLLTWPDPLLAMGGVHQTASFRMSYGRSVLFDFLDDVLRTGTSIKVGPSVLALCSWTALGIASIIAVLWARRIPPISEDSDHRDGFLIGSGIFLGTFVLGSNYDYKLVFLVFLIPQAIAWIQHRGRLAAPAYLLLTFVMISLWIEPVFNAITGRSAWYPVEPALILQELANWLLLISVAALNLAILRGWVVRWRRDWRAPRVSE